MNAARSFELELLLHSIRPPASAEIGDTRDKFLAPAIDWPAFLAGARRHRLLPLAAARLAPFRDRLPPDAAAGLAGALAANAARQSMLEAALVELCAAFEAAGVHYLACRGPVLARLAYGSPDLRQSDDLDFIVPPADMSVAIDVLLGLGRYEPYLPVALNRDWRRESPRAGMVFAERDGRFWIDLKPSASCEKLDVRLNAEWVWGDTVRVKIGGREVPACSPRAYALHLAAHGAKHLWDPLSRLADIAAVLSKLTPADWPEVIREARAAHGMRALCLAARMVETGIELPLPAMPDSARKTWPDADRMAGRLMEDARAQFQAARQAPRPPAYPYAFRHAVAVHLAVHERVSGRLRYLAHLALAPTYGDRRTVALPSGWRWLYVPLHPVLWCRRRWAKQHPTPNTQRSTRKTPHTHDLTPAKLSAASALAALLADGQVCRIAATGASMWPLIRDGDVLTIEPAAFDAIRIGDVIVSRPDPRKPSILIHRVIHKRGDLIRTRGDHRRAPDAEVAVADVIGRVRVVHRPTGRRVRLGLGPEARALGFLGRYAPVSVWLRLPESLAKLAKTHKRVKIEPVSSHPKGDGARTKPQNRRTPNIEY